jgi:hypothetical protein
MCTEIDEAATNIYWLCPIPIITDKFLVDIFYQDILKNIWNRLNMYLSVNRKFYLFSSYVLNFLYFLREFVNRFGPQTKTHVKIYVISSHNKINLCEFVHNKIDNLAKIHLFIFDDPEVSFTCLVYVGLFLHFITNINLILEYALEKTDETIFP